MVFGPKKYTFNINNNPLRGIVSLGAPSSDANYRVSQVAQHQIAAVGAAIVDRVSAEIPPIGHCPMSKKEINEHSLLNELELDDFPNLKEMMDGCNPEDAVLKLAANFLGGGVNHWR